MHGPGRFVTSRHGLKKGQVEVLNSLARKVGLPKDSAGRSGTRAGDALALLGEALPRLRQEAAQ